MSFAISKDCKERSQKINLKKNKCLKSRMNYQTVDAIKLEKKTFKNFSQKNQTPELVRHL